jgi:phage-related protein
MEVKFTKKTVEYLDYHAIKKKTDKTPKVEIECAESLRVKYFNEKK